MGTNYYFRGSDLEDSRSGDHIGKRSAAGAYCWDCMISLCRYGEREVHKAPLKDLGNWFFNICPNCGKSPQKMDFSQPGHAAGIELGFSSERTKRDTGVTSCSSFSWDIGPDKAILRLWAGEEVIDEYGHEMSAEEFLAMLDLNCPIRFYDSIGRDFS